jgi:hypothetical protein
MTPVTVSKSSQWDCQNSYVKVPVRLLLCDSLTANAKLLWIALANQAGFRPISKSVLDLRLGVHRSTRSRLMEELTDAGFIEGTARHIYLKDPIPVFDRLEAEDQVSLRLTPLAVCRPWPEIPSTKSRRNPRRPQET